jgi:hypothetical protein
MPFQLAKDDIALLALPDLLIADQQRPDAPSIIHRESGAPMTRKLLNKPPIN